MFPTRRGRLGFALFVLAALLVIGRNVYHRYQESTLADAVKDGDDAAAAALVKQGMYGGSSRQLEQLLSDALMHNEPNTARALLERGVNPNSAPNPGITHLIEAAGNCPDVVGLLLDKGANVNGYGSEAVNMKETALTVAIGSHHLDTVRLLLERGADANLRDMQESAFFTPSGSPLEVAASQDDKASVTLLLAHGARLETESSNESALEVAATRPHGAVLPLLLSTRPSQPLKSKALSEAVWYGNADNARVLLDAGARPAAQSPKWLRAVYVARKQSRKGKPGYAEVMALLRPLGVTATPTKAELDTSNAEGQTPLQAALAKADVEEARGLLAQGANVNTADKQGRTPLLEAMEHCLVMMTPLLAHKANPNRMSSRGDTPLKQAVLAGNISLVRQLLAAGADANLHPAQFHSVLYFARKHKQSDIVALLQQAGGREE